MSTPIPNKDILIPPHFKLHCVLRGHTGVINWITWSPDGQTLASGSNDQSTLLWDIEYRKPSGELGAQFGYVYSLAWSPDGQLLASSSGDDTIRIWDTQTNELSRSLRGHSYDDIPRSMTMPEKGGHTDWVRSLAWSPDGQLLASGSRDTTVRLWDTKTWVSEQVLKGHSEEIHSLAWSPDGRILASGSHDKTIRLWEVKPGKLLHTFTGHYSEILSVAWSPDSRFLASASADDTIRYWDLKQKQTGVLEGHTNQVTSLSFSANSRFLASKSIDNTVRVWRCDTWEVISILTEATSGWSWERGLAFHQKAPVLATLGENGKVIRIWELDFNAMSDAAPVSPSVFYTNAKVVLAGDTGVGKSGLSLVLTGQDFAPTESTHGRQVWTFDSEEFELGDGRRETREILLWDLAGQPGYRLIHQLHLTEVTVGLVVFDARSETDPFAGVRHWDRALRQAQRIQGKDMLPLRKLLVSARADRGGVGVSQARVEAVVKDLGFDGYYETSAKEGWQISELVEAIRKAIDWENLPRISSTLLFQHIKAFLMTEKNSGRLLATIDDLYRAYLKSDEVKRYGDNRLTPEAKDLREQFEACSGRVESRGLIRRLSFGGLVLLQPELLDAYASAIINTAKEEPDGLGCLAEEDVRVGRFRMSKDERIRDKDVERLFLIATIEDLLHHEIALLETSDAGPILIFPSQFTREYPNASDPEGKAVIYSFEGAVLNIYTTLAVRLARSGLFKKKQMWKNATNYTAINGGTCGIFLRELEEGHGEITITYSKETNQTVRLQFETYIQVHLQRRALRDSIERRRVIVCEICGFVVTEQLIQLRLTRNYEWVNCPVCNERISLEEIIEKVPATIPTMDRAADKQRDEDTAKATVEGKIVTKDFDVFLCHNSVDKPEVKEIGELLKDRGILPWLDEWELQPGLPWEKVLEEQIEQIKSAAVFVGGTGIGPWQDAEIYALLRQFVNRGCSVIPVFLSTAEGKPKLPIFLQGMTWVDFREHRSNPLNKLIWGITGKRENIFFEV